MKFDLSIGKEAKASAVYLNQLRDSKERIEIKPFKKQRTLNQNAYFHVICTILSVETGYTTEEVKHILKVNGGLAYEKGGHQIVRSTANLNKEEFAELIDRSILFASDHGFIIPTPEEYFNNEFEILQQLKL